MILEERLNLLKLSRRKRGLQELAAYDEKQNNKALGFIEIDLDDGVPVNYGKFEGLVQGYEKVSSPLTQTISGTTDTLLMVEIYKNMTKINSEEI